MVVSENRMYCREQIVIPEQLPGVLKQYAKAVIRTQPYDLLRWSAAYFRCLALEQTPPAKLRYEPIEKYGELTKGYIRVLIEQIGKAYYVRRGVLENRWKELCLPEDQLLEFFSLSRMFKWNYIHWLKLVALMIATLNQSLPATMRMICELLTDEPEGSPSPIPMWMFRTCYKFLAELDCSEPQTFIDGKKILDKDILDEDNPEPEPPEIHSSKVFQDLLLAEWKSRMKYDPVVMNRFIENQDGDESTSAISELASNASKVDSNFKFVGNYDDPAEVIRRAPDFDSVIFLLQDEINDLTSSKSIEEILSKLNSAEEESCDDEVREIFNDTAKQQKVDILKQIAPPWSWLHHFSAQSCPEKSFNFTEPPGETEIVSESDHELELRESTRPPPPSGDLQASVVPSEGTTIIGESLSEIMCNLSEASSIGECSLTDISSIISVLESQIDDETTVERIKSFLLSAEENGVVFNDLKELQSYIMTETIKEDASEEQKENIVTVFEKSGIDVDHKLLEKRVSSKMILGLVDKSDQENENGDEKRGEETQLGDVESVKSIQSDDTTTASVVSLKVKKTTRDEEIQTTPLYERRKGQMKEGEAEKAPEVVQKQLLEDFKCDIPELPGIGKRVGEETIENFLLYLMSRAREQRGLIYLRNLEEKGCPPMVD